MKDKKGYGCWVLGKVNGKLNEKGEMKINIIYAIICLFLAMSVFVIGDVSSEDADALFQKEFIQIRKMEPTKYNDKKREEVIAKYKALLVKYPKKEEFLLLELSGCSQAQYRYLEAIEILQKILEKYPQTTYRKQILWDLADYYEELYYRENKTVWLDLSEKYYKKVLEVLTDDNRKAEAYFCLNRIYLIRKDYGNFLTNSENILKYTPEKYPECTGMYSKTLNDLGHYYDYNAKEFDFAKSLEYYKKSLDVSREYYKKPYPIIMSYKGFPSEWGYVAKVEYMESLVKKTNIYVQYQKNVEQQNSLEEKISLELQSILVEKIVEKENIEKSKIKLVFKIIAVIKDEKGDLTEVKANSWADGLKFNIDSRFVKTKDKWNLKDLEFVEKGTSKYKKVTK